ERPYPGRDGDHAAFCARHTANLSLGLSPQRTVYAASGLTRGSALWCKEGASRAFATNLDNRLARPEVIGVHPRGEAMVHLGIRELGNLAATLANRESNRCMGTAIRMRAGDESIQAFEAMDQAQFQQ